MVAQAWALLLGGLGVSYTLDRYEHLTSSLEDANAQSDHDVKQASMLCIP